MMKGHTLYRNVTRTLVVLSLVALWAPQSRAAIYEGELSTANGGLVAGGGWGSGSTLSWTVRNDSLAHPSLWHYSYTLEVSNAPDISHLILEVSDGFDSANIFDPSWGNAEVEIGLYSSTDQGASNPELPESMSGLKIGEFGDTRSYGFDFYSDRVPVWGDFYAKGAQVYLYNAGFGNPDSDPDSDLYPAQGESVLSHVLVPDTIVVPVPGAVLLGTIGLGIASSRLRRQRA